MPLHHSVPLHSCVNCSALVGRNSQLSADLPAQHVPSCSFPACSWLCGTRPRPFCSPPGSSSWLAGGSRSREDAAAGRLLDWHCGQAARSACARGFRVQIAPILAPKRAQLSTTPRNEPAAPQPHPFPPLPCLLIPARRTPTLSRPAAASLACHMGQPGPLCCESCPSDVPPTPTSRAHPMPTSFEAAGASAVSYIPTPMSACACECPTRFRGSSQNQPARSHCLYHTPQPFPEHLNLNPCNQPKPCL